MSFFMDSKKRDLSDGSKSKNGEDSKKIKVDYDNINSMLNEVFRDGLSFRSCAKILVYCLRNIESQLNELYILHEDTKKLTD